MALIERVQADAVAALKAGDRERAGALRLIVSELQKAEKDGGADEVEVLARERKRRLESAQAYRDADRSDLAASEEGEAALIEATCPSSSPTRSCTPSWAMWWPRRGPPRRRRWAR